MAPRPLDLMKGSSSFTRIFPRPQNWTQAVDQATGKRAYYVKPEGFHLLPFVTFGHLFILAPCSISVFFSFCFQTAGESLFTSSHIPCLIARRDLVHTWRGTLGGENQVACCKKWHSWTSRGQSSLGTEHKTNYDYLLYLSKQAPLPRSMCSSLFCCNMAAVHTPSGRCIMMVVQLNFPSLM